MPNIKLMESALPVAPLKIAALDSCIDLGKKVNDYIVTFRQDSLKKYLDSPLFSTYKQDNYLIDCQCPRFGSGEAKGILGSSIRGKDLFVMVDVCNHSLTYTVNGHLNHMSPDDHYQDLKRVISAANGKAHRVNVIMPFLWTVLLPCRNWSIWVSAILLLLTLMIHVYRILSRFTDLTTSIHLISL